MLEHQRYQGLGVDVLVVIFRGLKRWDKARWAKGSLL